MTTGIGCATQPTTAFPFTTPTAPPTPPPPTQPRTYRPTYRPITSHRRVDPYNCAVKAVDSWPQSKKQWCCRVHHIGCPPARPPIVLPPIGPTPPPIVVPPTAPIAPIAPIAPVRPAGSYNCAAGYANWQAGWSVGKKVWCCRTHGKGCPGQIATTSKPYDCFAGYANWMVGWSVTKKAWCCTHEGKGCPPAAGGCA